MPNTTISERPSTPPALTPAPAVVAQLTPEVNETPDVPQDPGASLEENVTGPVGDDQSHPLSAISGTGGRTAVAGAAERRCTLVRAQSGRGLYPVHR